MPTPPDPDSPAGGAGHQETRVVVLSAHYPPAFLGGGPIRAVAALVSTAPRWAKTSVITSSRDLGRRSPMEVPCDRWLSTESAQVYYASVDRVSRYARALLESRRQRPDFVYLNSYFEPKFSIVPQLLARVGFFGKATIVLEPHGEFAIGALSAKSAKKKTFLAIYKALRMERKVIWQASSTREQADIRRIFPRSDRIVVREDDVKLPMVALTVPPRDSRTELRAVALGRVVPIKGITLLLEALVHVKNPIVLDIVGPEEDPSYFERCKELATRLPEHVKVTFKGPIDHSEVREVLSGYDVMLFPTKGENFGHVIAEALSASCPVMCSDTTPWTQRLRDGGGVVVEPREVSAWTEGVDAYADLSPSGVHAQRTAAATVYAKWRADSVTRPHLFALLLDT